MRAEKPLVNPATLFVHCDRIVWASASFIGGVTSRPACALLIGAEQALTVTVEGELVRSRALLVGPNVSRQLVAENAGFYSLTLDPAHPGCRHLRGQIPAGKSFLDVGAKLDASAINNVRLALQGEADCAASRKTSDALLSHFFPGALAAPAIEPRVTMTAAWLREHLPPRVDMRQLSQLCQLSAGRLTHLFSEELGVSIRSYLRWVKMCKAVELLGSRRTVTEVAATIGFADAAHFTRALRSYYSAAPSFIANPSLVQVHACNAGRSRYVQASSRPHA